MWLLVDGIYQTISWFVKTIQEPIGKIYHNIQNGKEICWRGIWCSSTQIPFSSKENKQWYVDDIANIVVSTFVLLNMMVCHPIASDENENISFYESGRRHLNRQQAELLLYRWLEIEAFNRTSSIIP